MAHSGRKGQVGEKVQKKVVAPVSTVNDDTAWTIAEVHSDVGTILLGNTIRKAKEWAQSISELVYEKKGDYFVDWLNRMWAQKQPLASIEVVDSDCWGTFYGNYFRRIEVPDLLQHQKFVPHPENDASSKEVTDATSFFRYLQADPPLLVVAQEMSWKEYGKLP
jgi:hypothetical protein